MRRGVQISDDREHDPRPRGPDGGSHPRPPRKVDIRLPGKGDSNSHGARPVFSMIKRIRTSGLSITKWTVPPDSCASLPPSPPRPSHWDVPSPGDSTPADLTPAPAAARTVSDLSIYLPISIDLYLCIYVSMYQCIYLSIYLRNVFDHLHSGRMQ